MSWPEQTGFLSLANKNGASHAQPKTKRSSCQYLTGCTMMHTGSRQWWWWWGKHTQVNNIVQLILVLFWWMSSVYLFNYPLTFHKSRTFHEYWNLQASRCCESGTLWTLGCHSRSFFTWKPPSSPAQVQNAPTLWEMHERQRRRSHVRYQRCSDKESRYSWGADGKGRSGGGAFPCSQAGEKRWMKVEYSQSCVLLLFNFHLLLKTETKTPHL